MGECQFASKVSAQTLGYLSRVGAKSMKEYGVSVLVVYDKARRINLVIYAIEGFFNRREIIGLKYIMNKSAILMCGVGFTTNS